MKRWLAVALVVAGVAAPVCAQRGGSRGGVSGHSIGGFRGSYAPSGRISFAGPSRVVGGSYGYAGRPGYGNGRRYYGAGVPFVPYYGASYYGPGYLAYPDTIYPDAGYAGDQAPPQNYVEQGGPGLPPPPAGYDTAQAEAAAPRQATAAPEPEDAVTVVFKDGRPPVTIHNYILSRTTLYVRDARKQDIPVADIDLPATEKANQDAGVEFQLPTASR
jgi:hypothetical protein